MRKIPRSRRSSHQTRPSRKADRRGNSWQPRIEALERRIVLSLVTWTGPATGGDWSTAGDWSTGKVPGASDTASIGSGNTVAFSAGDTSLVAALDLNGTLDVNGGNLTIGNTAGTHFTLTTGGSVSGDGSLDVNDDASNTWSGGTMTGTGAASFASSSSLTLGGTTDVLAGGWTLGGAGAATLAGELNAGSGGGTLNFSALQWTSNGAVDLVGNTF